MPVSYQCVVATPTVLVGVVGRMHNRTLNHLRVATTALPAEAMLKDVGTYPGGIFAFPTSRHLLGVIIALQALIFDNFTHGLSSASLRPRPSMSR
jgi:hypothetical protein